MDDCLGTNDILEFLSILVALEAGLGTSSWLPAAGDDGFFPGTGLDHGGTFGEFCSAYHHLFEISGVHDSFGHMPSSLGHSKTFLSEVLESVLGELPRVLSK